MKFLISEEEKSRILEMHQNATSRQYLTEARVELMGMPQVKAAAKFFKDAYDKEVPTPSYILGQYLLKTNPGTDFNNGSNYEGNVLGFGLARFGTMSIPILPLAEEGGYFVFENSSNPAYPLGFKDLYWDNEPFGYIPKDSASMATRINNAFNRLQLKDIQTMYDATVNKRDYDTAIAQFKASNSPLKGLLTGNAKSFYGV